MTKTVLLELGLEEIPAYIVTPAMNQLKDKVADFLANNRLSFDGIEAFSTPRRLAVRVRGLAERQTDLTEDFKKYEEFLKENDINLDELDKLDEEKEEKDENFDDDLEDLDLKIEDFAGKSDDEIREVVKKYPPHLQEIILKELLGDDE